MELALFLLKGILIGLLFGVPVGAVGTMAIQRTLEHGIKAGLITGLGSSAADCIYVSIGVFGLTLVSDFLLKYQTAITVIGGGFIIAMGICSFAGKPHKKSEPKKESAEMAMFLSAFVVGITNPAAILTFLFAFSYFNLTEGMTVLNGALLVLGVLAGTFVWWLLLSFAAGRFREKAVRHQTALSRIFGCLLFIFGMVIWIRLLFGEVRT